MLPAKRRPLPFTNFLFQILLNPHIQATKLENALEQIASLVSLSEMREQLYICCYEAAGEPPTASSLPSRTMYKEKLEALYRQILKFQVHCFCHLAEGSGYRRCNDLIAGTNWEGLLREVKAKDEEFEKVNDLIKDERYQEELDRTREQYKEESKRTREWHEEIMGELRGIGSNVQDLSGNVADIKRVIRSDHMDSEYEKSWIG